MHVEYCFSTLILSSLALASPTPAKSPPSIGSLGTLQVLKYNNLGPENNGSAAVLVHDLVNNSQAREKCTAIGESLYPFDDASSDNQTELKYQLDYLVFVQDLQDDGYLWVSKGPSKDCWAYSYSKEETVRASCDSRYPAICTSNVPPTTDKNRAAVNSSKLAVSFYGYNMTGYRDARSFRFLGIPFANPPVKDLRFMPPQAYNGSKSIDATVLADSCIQSVSSFGTLDNGGISEDCLYLNIYTPVLPAKVNRNSARRPVAVYFYGGAFISGTASMIDYDGGNFASRNDVVVVTVNYRVGALGFLSTGNLTSGSYGIRDQMLALQWVNKHIAAFGGDASHITIFGQSAGGQSVVALLSSTAAKGLFSGAIVQSAPVDLPWFTRDVYSELVAPEVARAVGCNGTTSEQALLACLQSVPATHFLDNSTTFKSALSVIAKNVSSKYLHSSVFLASTEPFLPMVGDGDSGIIDGQFHTLLAENRLPSRVPVMFTTVMDEAALYVGRTVPTSMGSNQTALNALFDLTFPPDLTREIISSGAFAVNSSDPDGVRNAAADALTHSEWTCPQSYLLGHGGTSSFPVLYELEITQGHIQTTVKVPEVCSPNDNYNATCHASDVLLIWGTLNSKTKNVQPYYSDHDIVHSQLLHDVFGSFLRRHNPNPDVEWLRVRGPAYKGTYDVFVEDRYRVSEYRNADGKVSVLGWEPSLRESPGRTEKCAVFEEFGYTFQRANFTG